MVDIFRAFDVLIHRFPAGLYPAKKPQLSGHQLHEGKSTKIGGFLCVRTHTFQGF